MPAQPVDLGLSLLPEAPPFNPSMPRQAEAAQRRRRRRRCHLLTGGWWALLLSLPCILHPGPLPIILSIPPDWGSPFPQDMQTGRDITREEAQEGRYMPLFPLGGRRRR